MRADAPLVRLVAIGLLAGVFSSLFGVGGGLIVFFGDHVGIRGDIRYFHSFQEFEIPGPGFSIDGQKLDFGRAGGALVFKF